MLTSNEVEGALLYAAYSCASGSVEGPRVQAAWSAWNDWRNQNADADVQRARERSSDLIGFALDLR